MMGRVLGNRLSGRRHMDLRMLRDVALAALGLAAFAGSARAEKLTVWLLDDGGAYGVGLADAFQARRPMSSRWRARRTATSMPG